VTATTLPAPTALSAAEETAAATNVGVIRRLAAAIQHYFQTGDDGPMAALFAPDFVNHIPSMPANRDELLQALAGFRAAFPDLRVTLEDAFACGDKVADRMTWTATQTGPLMGMPPSGKRVSVGETHIARIAGGKIVERWGHWDALGMLQQVGAVPSPDQGH
jgi:steroid delta-isomerase-like uncharacterized protein